ncbi:energy transducer TonB [Luteimonas sp. XNQY3]|nr:energy transducer TonB [Luteimonas sp. XNQY3]MCD9006905.1 energy transducer TonB [Luteimonas sp. XNQY3]
MNDPVQRPINPPPQDPPPPEPPRKGSSPLVWILLLVVLVALGWYALSQRGTTGTPELPPTPVIDDPAAPPVEREPTTTPRTTPRAETAPARPADREARPVAQPEIPYPPAAARSREEGSLILLVQVDANGNATDVTVEKRSGSRDLDRAAQQAVRDWKFEPAIKGGKPSASAVRVPIDFTLQDAG